MTRIISCLLCLLVLLTMGRVHASDALPAYQVYEQTPVIFSEKTDLLVLRDRDGRQNAEEAMKRRAEFVPLVRRRPDQPARPLLGDAAHRQQT